MPIPIEGSDLAKILQLKDQYHKLTQQDTAIDPLFTIVDMAHLSLILLYLDDANYVEYITACGYASI